MTNWRAELEAARCRHDVNAIDTPSVYLEDALAILERACAEASANAFKVAENDVLDRIDQGAATGDELNKERRIIAKRIHTLAATKERP